MAQGAQSVSLLTNDIEQDVKAGGVVTRVVGQFQWKSVTDDQETRLGLGIVMMGADAFSGGAIPDIGIDDPAWLYLYSGISLVGSATAANNSWLEVSIDTKAKRKFRSQDQRLVLVVENISDTGVSLEFVFQLRTLIFIP